MWVVAGILLGVVVLASLVGFHIGPHSHAIAGGVGIVAAVWLIIMAATGNSAPLLWALFSADVVVSAGVGYAAYKGLTAPAPSASLRRLSGKPDGAEGVAKTDLSPDGIVQVRGESWSATSVNGPIKAGSTVQVIETDGVHIRVWGLDSDAGLSEPIALDHP